MNSAGYVHRSDRAHAGTRAAVRMLDLRYPSAGAFLIAYSTRLSRGELFVETPEPLPVGSRAVLRLHAPGAPSLEVEGNVTWARLVAIGPGQPAGMGITLASSIEEHGAVIDELVFRHARPQIVIASAEAAPRAVLARYLRSILSCDLVPADLRPEESPLSEQIDLAVVDLDSEPEWGARVIRTLRQHSATAGVPVIALAQRERDRVRAAMLDVDEVLTTPPVFSELRSTVLHALSRPLLARTRRDSAAASR
ncbi:MAG: hypothetical protein ABUL67_03730 [Haliangium ochraceum]